MASLFKLALSGCFCCLLLKGFYDSVFDLYPNHCKMTYMYQLPEYIEIPVNKSATLLGQVPYKLYAYGEGFYAESLRYGKFNGIPVLFIPGNGGSYKQVRSSASVALRKYIDSKKKFHFDFFAADFNEELSALSGPLLGAETEYVKLCIRKIISLYEDAGLQRSSVVLIGHSLGGMVAMASTIDEYLRSRISAIINLASPLDRPIVVTDTYLDNFYDQVSSYWTDGKQTTLKHITVVSIGAGRNDFQVPTFFTSSKFIDVDTSTLSVPSCWLTTDHRAVVWCKQLVLATVRALFDSADSKTMSLNRNKDVVLAAFKYHLLERSRSKEDFRSKFIKNLTSMQNTGSWSQVSSRQEHFDFYRQPSDKFVMIPVHTDDKYHKHLAIVSREFDWINWVFVCKVNSRPDGSKKCVDEENLSGRSVSIPGSRKGINIDMTSINRKGFDHVVIWIQRTDDKATLDIDVSDGLSRSKAVQAPILLNSYFFPALITEATPFQALTYNVSITGITESWQSYVLSVNELHKCDHSTKLPIVKIRPSWMTRWHIVLFGPSKSEFVIEVDAPHGKRSENSTVEVHMLLDPSCTYNISLQTNPFGALKRVSLIYGAQIPAFIACHLLLSLANQIQVIGETNKCPSTISSLMTLTPLSVVPFATMLDYGLGMFEFDTNFRLMDRFGIDVGLFPIFLFLSTFPLTILITSFVWAAVVIWGKAAHYYAERFLKRSLGAGEIATTIVMYGVVRYPFVLAVILVAMTTVTCCSLVLILAFLYYFMKMFKLYEDYLEKVVVRLVRRPTNRTLDEDLSSINLNFTLMLLVLLLAALTSPGLIEWLAQRKVHNLYDKTFLMNASVLISFGYIWQIKLCQPSIYYKSLSVFLKMMAISTILFGCVTMYNVITTVSLAIIAVVVQQLAANGSLPGDVIVPSNNDNCSNNESEADPPCSKGSIVDTPSPPIQSSTDDSDSSADCNLSNFDDDAWEVPAIGSGNRP